MHTSTRLAAGDFDFAQMGAEGAHTPIAFATFCPDYHEQDRIGVVSLGLEEGVLHTSHALLALTTAFYVRLRARQAPFFDYPQHFAFVGAENQSGDASAYHGAANQQSVVQVGGDLLPAAMPHLWDAWSWLDVWPANKWLTAPPTVAGMIQRVFDYQINRLFWPRALNIKEQRNHAEQRSHKERIGAEGQAAQLPGYVWKMLHTSLKAVYLYGPESAHHGAAEIESAESTASPWATLYGERIELRAQPAAQEIVQESIAQLPAPLLMRATLDSTQIARTPQCYTRVPVPEFLAVLEEGR